MIEIEEKRTYYHVTFQINLKNHVLIWNNPLHGLCILQYGQCDAANVLKRFLID